jgi:hypothetical protein
MAKTTSIDVRKAALRVLQALQQMVAPCFFNERFIPGLKRLPPDAKTAFTNAIVDGSLVSIRAFNEFLESPKKHPDNLNCGDFPGFTHPGKILTSSERTELHKKVAHLSTIYLDTEQAFPFKKYLKAALPIMISFCDYLLKQPTLFDKAEMEYIAGTRESFLLLQKDLTV